MGHIRILDCNASHAAPRMELRRDTCVSIAGLTTKLVDYCTTAHGVAMDFPIQPNLVVECGVHGFRVFDHALTLSVLRVDYSVHQR